ncbi:DUF1997 domain-containing protein [Lyngbya confervoides]|uniref:DUF1997 domain-containing protein n=1 Tax=Lyngbya confervoides BDU141951 TaxID=1574623 RepID=A0ABD4T584_9CYAN|nr:DUF1997 domain-containing protein [Lyngbya confervoides]MCM1983578.1 DUF1997 domain-containing protein [Lyngbya confervoides BDU141951]
MQAHFKAVQKIAIPITPGALSIGHYLRQPQRLIHALVDPEQITQLAPDRFRLQMRSRPFLMLTLQPTVDIQIWLNEAGAIQLRAIDCELRGVDYINQRFKLDLDGVLAAYTRENRTELRGTAHLRVDVHLPPALWMTPRSILHTTGNSLLKGILTTVKQRLVQQIVQDYQLWCQAMGEQPDSLSSPSLPVPDASSL